MTKFYTENQKEAIEHYKGPLLIVAGPGAGKTRVLVERVLYLIETRNVDPNKILVTTFNIKAAEELKARITEKIGVDADPIQVSTIHSFCKNLLERYADYHDFGASFDVLDEDEQMIFLREYLKELNVSDYKLPNFIYFYNKCSENRIDPDILIQRIHEEYPYNENYMKICKSYKRYLELLEESNKIDFAGLQQNLLTLLEGNKAVLDDVRNNIDFVMVDEYQDINPLQDNIFELIIKPKCNICVVGDDDQSIYSFRGSDIQNFIQFPNKYSDTKVVRLDKNFRSTKNIVDISEDFIKNYRILDKQIKPNRGRGNEIVLLKNVDEHDEARKVVEVIKAMKEMKIIPHYGYVALLFRSVKNHAGHIIAELKEHKIPYSIKGDGSFLKREEIRTILFLLFYVDPNNYKLKFKSKWGQWWNISLLETEVLNLSQKTIKELHNLDNNFDLSILKTKKEFNKIGITNPDDYIKLIKLNQLKLRLSKKQEDILFVFYEILKISGYLKRLVDSDGEISENSIYNIAKFSHIINKYDYFTKNPTIEDFLKFLYSLPRKMQYDEDLLEDPHALKLMTVHQAKGLEFPVVFICNVVKNKFPVFHKQDNDAVPIPADLLLNKIENPLSEERRLFYVAMTRAQDNLIVSTSNSAKNKVLKYSSFITDIGLEKFADISSIIDTCKERDILNEPQNISYSSIDAYNICPFRYKLLYDYKFKYMSNYMQKYGTILHNSLNRIHLAMEDNLPIKEDLLKSIVEKCWVQLHESLEEDESRKQILIKRLTEYVNVSRDYIKEVISTEEPFSIFKNNMLVNGRTDLIMKNIDDEMELVDFKARGETGLEITEVELQLKVYEYALQDKYNFDKLCAYHFLTNERSYFETDINERRETEKHLEEVCKRIRDEEFKMVLSSYCSTCFFNFCCL